MAASLTLAGLAMGLTLSPHCAAMCGAPCAMLSGACRRAAPAFHLGRLLSYMAGGAIAASGIAWIGALSAAAPMLRPLWTLLHLGFLGLGLWWLGTGRHPAWLLQPRVSETPLRFMPAGPPASAWRPGAAGLAWIAWPCAALQGGLLLAALAGSAWDGALVMGAFALGSMPALAAAPWIGSRWRRWRGRAAGATDRPQSLGFRWAGAVLVLSSAWALAHLLGPRLSAWCGAQA